MAQPRPVAEYYTQEEMVEGRFHNFLSTCLWANSLSFSLLIDSISTWKVKFKKPKKRRKIKKRETLKVNENTSNDWEYMKIIYMNYV